MPQSTSWTSRIVWGAMALGIAFLILGPIFTRIGIITFMNGFISTAIGGVLIILSSIIAIIRMVPTLRSQGKAHLMAATVMGICIIFYMFNLFSGARAAPPIHDLSTDLDNPPQFETIAARQYPKGQLFTDVQRRVLQKVGYRDLGPLKVSADVATAAQTALDVLDDMGMDIAASDLAAGKIEATDTTLWFGFKDDVVVRVTADGESGGSIIDIRSVSRVGIGDAGANANRIMKIQSKITKALS